MLRPSARELMDLYRGALFGGFYSLARAGERRRNARPTAAWLVVWQIILSLQCADSLPFIPGNVVALIPQVQATTTNAASLVLTEYAPNGTAVQNIPVTGSCTVSGSASSEGKLESSYDGSRVTWACYACPAGTASVKGVRRGLKEFGWRFHPRPHPSVLPDGKLDVSTSRRLRKPVRRSQRHDGVWDNRLHRKQHSRSCDNQCGRGLRCRGCHEPWRGLRHYRRWHAHAADLYSNKHPVRQHLRQHALLLDC